MAPSKSLAKPASPRKGRIPAGKAGERNAAILDAATAVFFRSGFDRCTMSVIAKEAGCSLETLYTSYPNKETLFSALIVRKASALFEAMGVLNRDRDLREGLTAFAAEMLSMMAKPDTRMLHRLVIGESRAFPDLAKTFWKEGPGRSIRDLTSFLSAKQKEGALHLSSPETAAEIFMALLLGDATMRYTLGLRTAVDTGKQQADWAQSATGLFLDLLGQGRI